MKQFFALALVGMLVLNIPGASHAVIRLTPVPEENAPKKRLNQHFDGAVFKPSAAPVRLSSKIKPKKSVSWSWKNPAKAHSWRTRGGGTLLNLAALTGAAAILPACGDKDDDCKNTWSFHNGTLLETLEFRFDSGALLWAAPGGGRQAMP